MSNPVYLVHERPYPCGRGFDIAAEVLAGAKRVNRHVCTVGARRKKWVHGIKNHGIQRRLATFEPRHKRIGTAKQHTEAEQATVERSVPWSQHIGLISRSPCLRTRRRSAAATVNALAAHGLYGVHDCDLGSHVTRVYRSSTMVCRRARLDVCPRASCARLRPICGDEDKVAHAVHRQLEAGMLACSAVVRPYFGAVSLN